MHFAFLPQVLKLPLRRYRRHFGIAAPKVVVRNYMPTMWIVASICLLILLLISAWLLTQSKQPARQDTDIEALQLKINELNKELLIANASAGTGGNALSIERAVQQQLLTRVQELESENTALREEFLLIERLLTSPENNPGVHIEGFHVTEQVKGGFGYRVLLSFQSDRPKTGFKGHLQILVNYRLDNHEQQLTLPEKKSDLPQFAIEVSHFLRRTGEFHLPPSASLLSVEAQILQGGDVKSKRTVQF